MKTGGTCLFGGSEQLASPGNADFRERTTKDIAEDQSSTMILPAELLTEMSLVLLLEYQSASPCHPVQSKTLHRQSSEHTRSEMIRMPPSDCTAISR